MSFLDSLPTDTKDPSYGKALLNAVSGGNYTHGWAPVTSVVGGHTATFQVSADALKVEGVRVNASVILQQQIADMLGALLPTPKLLDLSWLQRGTTLPPSPIPISSMTRAMIDYNDKVDALLAKAGGAEGIVCTVGKSWCIDNDLLAHPSRAENYGFHCVPTSGTQYLGINTEALVSAPTLPPKQGRVIQGRGWAHDPTHLDYSQKVFLVRRDCVADGTAMDVAALLQDPELALLASHEGPLKLLRQPGVAVVACATPLISAAKRFAAETPINGGLCPTPKPPSKADLTWAWLLGGAIAAGAITAPLWWPWVRRRLR